MYFNIFWRHPNQEAYRVILAAIYIIMTTCPRTDIFIIYNIVSVSLAKNIRVIAKTAH